jgi:chemotaxis protein MotA
MEFLTLIGLVVGISAVTLGFSMEGGEISLLLQPQALLIVVGGTFGSILVQNNWVRFYDSLKLLGWLFVPTKPVNQASLAKLLEWGHKANLEGMLAMESIDTKHIGQFSARGLQMLANGVPTAILEDALKRELQSYERNQLTAAKIWQQAGGYSPTFGIVGAVIGLIHSTMHISNPAELGQGIAIAFVATLYGVGFANILYLPIYGKIRSQIDNELRHRKLYMDGILAISRKESPKTIETRLLGDIRESASDLLS